MLETIKQPETRAMLASQQQAHYSSDYDKRVNDNADRHSRLMQTCRAGLAVKAKGRSK